MMCVDKWSLKVRQGLFQVTFVARIPFLVLGLRLSVTKQAMTVAGFSWYRNSSKVLATTGGQEAFLGPNQIADAFQDPNARFFCAFG